MRRMRSVAKYREARWFRSSRKCPPLPSLPPRLRRWDGNKVQIVRGTRATRISASYTQDMREIDAKGEATATTNGPIIGTRGELLVGTILNKRSNAQSTGAGAKGRVLAAAARSTLAPKGTIARQHGVAGWHTRDKARTPATASTHSWPTTKPS